MRVQQFVDTVNAGYIYGEFWSCVWNRSVVQFLFRGLGVGLGLE